jgi:hypothetical protein
MKICRVVFSTNRPEFLIPTLKSHKEMIDFGDHEVHGILIDDYPKDRADDYFINLAQKYGFNELVLHEQNKGLTPTWTELWNYLSNMGFDYIWHHEDDVIFKTPVKIQTLIDFLEENKQYVQVNLKRNKWYPQELEQPDILDTDLLYKDYRFNERDDYFWTMASLYPGWVTQQPVKNVMNCNLAEWPVMQYFKNHFNMKMAILKNQDGSNMVNHIGAYSQGKRVEPGEPGWEGFKSFDSEKKYDSKTGNLYVLP